jgi:hypothetical protein
VCNSSINAKNQEVGSLPWRRDAHTSAQVVHTSHSQIFSSTPLDTFKTNDFDQGAAQFDPHGEEGFMACVAEDEPRHVFRGLEDAGEQVLPERVLSRDLQRPHD